jgi:hypothetical protein
VGNLVGNRTVAVGERLAAGELEEPDQGVDRNEDVGDVRRGLAEGVVVAEGHYHGKLAFRASPSYIPERLMRKSNRNT